MSFFVDANVPVYAAYPSGSTALTDACKRVVLAVAGGAEGRISTAVLEEVWHLELSGRIEGISGLAVRVLALFSPLLPVGEETVRLALGLDAPAIGANDRIHVATCLAHGIEAIVSADSSFDAIDEIRRVDPLDRAALAKLLDG